jgi:DNA-binding transcriptional ArsR family regulator
LADSSGDRITFPRLQQLLDITAGNLSTHLRKLADAGYVEITKTHQRGQHEHGASRAVIGA